MASYGKYAMTSTFENHANLLAYLANLNAVHPTERLPRRRQRDPTQPFSVQYCPERALTGVMKIYVHPVNMGIPGFPFYVILGTPS